MPFPESNVCPVRDKVGIGVAIQMLENYFCKGRNGRDYLKINTDHQLQAAVSELYSAMSMAQASRYSLNSPQVSVLHMYEGSKQSALM